MAKNKLTEGTLFSVPLSGGGFAIGLIARLSKRGGVLFGYFWGEWLALPDVNSLVISPSYAILIGRFGDLFLRTGRWTQLGKLPNWNRAEWPIPLFVREEPITGRRWEVKYSDDDPNAEVSECPARDGVQYLPDRMHGAEATEITLRKRLSSASVPEGHRLN